MISSFAPKEELEITEGKMRLAMKIADAIKAKGFNKNKQTGRFQKFNIKGTAFAISKNIAKMG